LRSDEIRIWVRDAIDIDGCFWGRQQLGVGEDLGSPMISTEHVCSLGRFNNGTDEGHKEVSDRLGERRHLGVIKCTLGTRW
jgi:hypothetical protein